jgi:serine protease Do
MAKYFWRDDPKRAMLLFVMLRRFKTILLYLPAAAMLCGGPSATALDSPALTLARQLNEAFIEVADKVSPAVVIIEVSQKVAEDDNQGGGSWWDLLPPEERPRHRFHRRAPSPQIVQGEGSGVIISEDGYILTNNHVVENAVKIVVKFKDGRTFDGEVRGADPASDIAVVKIKAKGLTPAALGDSDSTRVGEFVLAIGAPFTLSYSVTFGHVSAKGRSFESETSGYADQDFIQTDASINPGNSGGPLVNLYGEVIAINTMIEGMNTGIGFAVPINLAKRVKDHLIAEGKFTRSWIGVEIRELNDWLAYKNLSGEFAPDTSSGIVIVGLRSDGPAYKSGIQTGDVVVAVDGKKVDTSRQLKDAIALEKPGSTLTLDLVRAKQHLALKIQTAPLPSEPDLVADNKPQSGKADKDVAMFGMVVEPLTRDLADRYGVEAGSGIAVTSVEHDSPAEAENIQPGDVITQINRHRVTNMKQFRQFMRSVDPKKGVLVDLISEGSARMVVLKEGQ